MFQFHILSLSILNLNFQNLLSYVILICAPGPRLAGGHWAARGEARQLRVWLLPARQRPLRLHRRHRAAPQCWVNINICHLSSLSYLGFYLQISLLLWFYLWNLNAMMRLLFLINWLRLAEKCVLSPLESAGQLSVLHNCQLILEFSQQQLILQILGSRGSDRLNGSYTAGVVMKVSRNKFFLRC